MREWLIVTSVIAVLALPQSVAAQSGSGAGGTREISFSIGHGRLWHGDDVLGSGLTLGGAVTIPLMPRFALRIDGHRSYGPDLQERSCVSYPTSPCTGVGRYGVRGLTIWSVSGVYYFSPGRVQPYVSGGLDVLHFTTFSDVTTIRQGQVTITDFERHDTTMGVTFAGGVRIPIGRRIAVTPEIKIYDGTMLSGANLSQIRSSIAVGYRW